MTKRITRFVVYFALLAFTALVMSHPYVWQTAFGPKIKGEPLWAWQEEVRIAARNDTSPNSYWEKALHLLRLDHRPLQWIGAFDRSDPVMLPVLFSLADDSDDEVRVEVARSLKFAPQNEKTLETLIVLLNDRSSAVRVAAVDSLCPLVAEDQSCQEKLEERLRDADVFVRLHAARAILEAGFESRPAMDLMVDGMKSPLASIRRQTVGHLLLCKGTKNDAVIFASLIELAQTDPDREIRRMSIWALRNFGGKAVPALIPLLQDPTNGRCAEAIWTLGIIGPEAHAALPMLEILARHSDEFVSAAAKNALPQIDPKRAKK